MKILVIDDNAQRSDIWERVLSGYDNTEIKHEVRNSVLNNNIITSLIFFFI